MFRSIILSSLLVATTKAAQCPETWYCPFTETAPTLDADHAEWANVPSFSTSLVSILGSEYTAGDAELKCLHDNFHIFFALEIPGEYKFSTDDNHLCAAIGTMFKVGQDATYVDMGGCPDAALGCDAVPDTCSNYLVDLGAHWELRTAQQGVTYGANATSGTGDDPLANNDDEYAVHAECRFDDDGANAGNEWSGSWAHTNSVEGEMGYYHFELSRLLTTASTATDAQLSTGSTYQFGIAYWDPNQLEAGWTDSGHFLTGCANNWVNLVLDEPSGTDEETNGGDKGDTTDVTPNGGDKEETDSASQAANSLSAIATMAYLFFMW